MLLLLLARALVALRGNAGSGASEIDWVPPMSASLTAEATGKPVMYCFIDEWSPESRQVEEVIGRLAKRVNREVVPVRVTTRRGAEASEQRLVERHRIRRVPTVVFVDRSGVEGARIEGLRREEYFASVLDTLR